MSGNVAPLAMRVFVASTSLRRSVGVLAALDSTAAPLASPGRAPSDKIMLPALQAALRGELQRTLEVAVPKKAVLRGAARARTAAGTAAARDALDDLLDTLAVEPADDEGTEDTP